ncbi:MAG: 50S ribosomal protein L10 [Bacteroidota bacterium]|jgi:large subunit ribosomal protein L10
MKKEEKNALIDSLVVKLENNPNFYLTDASSLTVEKVNTLRRRCFDANINMLVVKNTLLKKAMDKAKGSYDELYGSLKGATAVMFCENGSAPAKLIKQFHSEGNKRPVLKAAFIEECSFIGADQLDKLATFKSRLDLIGDIIGSLQSPAKNIISALIAKSEKESGE